VVLEVVRGEGCSEEIETSIGQRFEAFFEPSVEFRTVWVAECRKTKTGKRNPIIWAWRGQGA
jgi:hypothetical protein